MTIALIILSVIILSLTVFVFRLYNRNSELQIKNNKLQKYIDDEKKEKEKIVYINPGDKGLIHSYELCTIPKNPSDKKIEFKVAYEVVIVDVAKDKLKVKATGFTSFDTWANDTKNKSSILDFLNDKWVSRSSVEMIMDNATRRNAKLEQILS